MTNYSSKIFQSSVSGIAAQQAVIAASANNIANVNTPGYTRRVVNLQTRGINDGGTSVNVGDGVDVTGVTRVVNSYLEKLLKTSTSDASNYEVQNEYMSQLEGLFPVDGSRATIGTSMTDFFSAVNDLTQDPSSIELRANVVEKAGDLVSTIKTTYNSIADLQTQADQRAENEIGTINNLSSQIAKLNGLITTKEASSGGVAADDRDQREQLMNELAEKIGFNSIELADGTVSLTLDGGYPLVSGSNSYDLGFTRTPSFTSQNIPKSLSGGTLGYVTYSFASGSGSGEIDITQTIMSGGGELGGLLTVRGYAEPGNTSPFQTTGPLVDIASRVEAVTRSLLTDINQTYLGPNEDATNPVYQSSARDIRTDALHPYGYAPDVYGLFDFDYSGVKDVNGNGQPDDLNALSPATISDFSSRLELTFTDPRRFAAAWRLDTSTGDVIYGTGNGKNAEALAAMSTSQISFAAGNYSLTATYDQEYNESVIQAGNYASSASANMTTAKSQLSATQSKRDEVSGVSLDEEFTNLIRYQKAFQASARLIKVADQMLEQIVSML